jgi:formylglycine-generating enzyme required for sulfatase activity
VHQPVTDPHIQASGSKAEHVIRGGSYGGREKELRISARQHRLSKDEVTNQTGFRCVLPEAALK